MISYIKSLIRYRIISLRHPELQSGEILDFDTVCKINEAYSKKGTIEDPLTPSGNCEVGYHGSHSELTDIFTGVELATWAIDNRTIDWFWDFLSENKPNTILEFGSGSSTCVFCAWMKQHNPNGIVISVEQSNAEAENTSARLAKHGLSGTGTVIQMDVDNAGRIIFNCEQVSRKLNGRKVDMVFVDGPAGPTGCRENTFVAAMPLLASHGYWFLHDSYRTGELNIISLWTKLKGVTIDGVLACGNGLGKGQWHWE